jgi:uncharacterized protein (DUF58 family)
MGEVLNRVRAQLNFDPRSVAMRLRSNRILEGGHTSLQFGRSDDFVDLREYVIGDDVRDIDWKASARSPGLVVRRYVAEKAQEFLLVADTGANLLATAPSGERKRDLALLALGAVGLVASAQSDKISVVYGDDRGSSIEPGKTGEDHLEQILTLINNTQIEVGNASNIVRQLEFIAANLDKRYAIYIVCDEPPVTQELVAAAMAVRGRSTIGWLLIEDLDVLGLPGTADEVLDVATGRALLTPAVLGHRVLDAYRRAEAARWAQWQAFTAQLGSPFYRISASSDIGPALAQFAQGVSNA